MALMGHKMFILFYFLGFLVFGFCVWLPMYWAHQDFKVWVIWEFNVHGVFQK